MYPPERVKREYEKVAVEVWVNGIIEEIQYKDDHENFNKEKVPGIRLKFALDGCKFPKYSRWMTFGLAEKSNLYKLVIFPLVENAKPFMRFDMDNLQGVRIKTMWSNNEEYQNLDMIRPLDKKVQWVDEPPETNAPAESIPF